ncbi:MAG TPA: 50S ribosomal protein L20 [Candidatus Aminicenantes bacterium]|nr:50S ribosomal protein L20 [Candidatus Aminicenantes bacterium]HRY64118.1 50S ribosomal protein L20 [Candidatus Aminicenantes bacterium]HRZ71031.1 50S ribosomal protein L20 [Candidatus Aminicenantes bacterium]
MPRVKRSTNRRDRRRKVLARAKGYFGAKSRNYRTAKEAVEKSLLYAYRDRRAKKRDFRSLWIVRIKAGAVANGTSYSRFMSGLKTLGVALDRKVLADLAVHAPETFAHLVRMTKTPAA